MRIAEERLSVFIRFIVDVEQLGFCCLYKLNTDLTLVDKVIKIR